MPASPVLTMSDWLIVRPAVLDLSFQRTSLKVLLYGAAGSESSLRAGFVLVVGGVAMNIAEDVE